MSLASTRTTAQSATRNTAPILNNAPSYGVPPVERAFKLLRHIASGDCVGNMSVTARALGLSRTTLMRLLATLEFEQLIERKADGSGYGLGLGLIGLAGQALYASDLVQIGDPVIKQLSEQLSLSAHIGVLDGTDVLYVARRTPNVHLVSNVSIGSRLPAHATTMGRIMLANMDIGLVRTLYSHARIERVTEKTPGTLADLLRQLSEDAKAGIAWSESHFEAGISSAACVIHDRLGKVVGAVNVTGPTASFLRHAGRSDEIGQAVLASASDISSRLGYMPRQSETPVKSPVELRRKP